MAESDRPTMRRPRNGAQRRMSSTSCDLPVKLKRREARPTTSISAALTDEAGGLCSRKRRKAPVCNAQSGHSSVSIASSTSNSAAKRVRSSVACHSLAHGWRSKEGAEDVPSARLPPYQHQPPENPRKRPAIDEAPRPRAPRNAPEDSAAPGSANLLPWLFTYEDAATEASELFAAFEKCQELIQSLIASAAR